MKQNSFTRMIIAMQNDTRPHKEDVVRATLARRLAAMDPGHSFQFEGIRIRRGGGRNKGIISVIFSDGRRAKYTEIPADFPELVNDLIAGHP
jgi:hypothetical protein